MNDAERSSSPNESQFEQWLTRMLFRADCIDSLVLSEYAGGRLEGDVKTMVEHHLNECPLCRKELALLKRVVADSCGFGSADDGRNDGCSLCPDG